MTSVLPWLVLSVVQNGAVLNLENPPLVLALLQIPSILQYSSIPRSTLSYSWEPGRRLLFSEFMRVIFVSPLRWQITWERWSSHTFLEFPPTFTLTDSHTGFKPSTRMLVEAPSLTVLSSGSANEQHKKQEPLPFLSHRHSCSNDHDVAILFVIITSGVECLLKELSSPYIISLDP